MSSADLLLHPVRLRILQTFLGDRTLTTADLQAELTDIPPASLYRHVAKLVDGGVLAVVGERRVRGAVERTYKLRTSEATVKPHDLAGLTPDEHRGMFMAFVAGLLREYDRYLDRGDVDLVRDGISYRLTGMWLTNGEARRLARELNDVLLPRVANTPRRGRKRWYFGAIAIPAPRLVRLVGHR
jgi:Helix-turn-helix domain